MTGLLDHYATRKRKRQLSSDSESDIAPAQAAGPSQPTTEGGSEVQAIIIHDSPKSGPIDQTEPTGSPGQGRKRPIRFRVRFK